MQSQNADSACPFCTGKQGLLSQHLVAGLVVPPLRVHSPVEHPKTGGPSCMKFKQHCT